MLKAKSKEVLIDVTEEEYEAGLASGLSADETLKPGRHVFRRSAFRERHPDFKPEDLEPRNIKVRVTMYLDLDVLNYFKERATPAHAAAYQTQINHELRRVMESAAQANNATAAGDLKTLLSDKTFIAAVAARVEEQLNGKKSRSARKKTDASATRSRPKQRAQAKLKTQTKRGSRVKQSEAR